MSCSPVVYDNVFDVTVYGADNNATAGSAACNVIAFEAAITAAITAVEHRGVGAKVYIPAGNYLLTGPIDISAMVTDVHGVTSLKSGTFIDFVGDGVGATLITWQLDPSETRPSHLVYNSR